jgi:LPS-assembly lipoprotein
MFKRCCLLLLVLYITGCGFKLRGMTDMPPWLNNIAIVVQDANRDLGTLLKDQFQAYGVQIIPDPTKADYLLIIKNDVNQQQITSISASTTPRQYQLTYTVRYSLVKVANKSSTEVSAPATTSTVSVSRQLTVNNDRILGSDSEGLMTYAEMRREAVMQIINRLSRK